MGILLKEALKGLCNSNQWSYAVFWKIGCQNPKILIWEECHYESSPSSMLSELENGKLSSREWGSRRLSDEKGSARFGIEADDKVRLLIDKMMSNNQINVVGEGLVGRAAFSGNHLWILAKCYNRNIHPPEVLNELHYQFSSGMQTIAVIPIFPHGVVQLGSSLAVMENMSFINDVKSLILHLGSIPGALLPEDYSTKDLEKKFHGPVPRKIASSMNPSAKVLRSSMVVEDYNQQAHSSQASEPVDYNPSRASSSFHHLNLPISSSIKPNHSVHGQWFNLQAPSGSGFDFLPGSGQSTVDDDCLKLMDQQILSGAGFDCDGNTNPSAPSSFNLSQLRISGGRVFENEKERRMSSHLKTQRQNQLSNVDHLKIDDFSYASLNAELIDDFMPLSENREEFLLQNQNSRLQEFKHEQICAQRASGDDLFDVLGVEFKSKLLKENMYPQNLGVDYSLVYGMHDSGALSDIYLPRDVVSDRDMFSYSDHLLDAVVSGGCISTKQSSEDNTSQKTTLTKISNSSSPSFSLASSSDHLQRELFDLPNPLDTRSSKSGCSKNDVGSCSQSNSIYKSQISSWVEQENSVKQDNSVSTAYSKRPNEVTKSNRKRLKPGENPKPRPKDRQMFQDRLKELREIVPNSSKCSIDALLERTIKHMLFLQSVTKHADKLKQTEESKIISNDGGLFLKDNLEGGATWAFEVGSDSMICPIIVKDLNPPRQMLVEMLCEDRGFFLEIADLIRGLGLTILKGVMEKQNDKIWARFAVEANRDVTRMEIFMSLVHVLEQTMKGGGACLGEDVDIGQLMVHNSFPQTTPIPATGPVSQCLV